MPAKSKKVKKTKAPTKTLTQRRSTAEPTPMQSKLSGLTPQRNSSLTSLSGGPQAPAETQQEGSPVKIIIWAVVILATGIGLALIVRNLTKDETTDTAEETTTEEAVVEETEETTEAEATEAEEADATETETETETETTTETETETTTTTTTGLTNEYSQADQTLADGVTSNIISLRGYGYETFSTNFVYTIKLGDVTKFPNVTASLNPTTKKLSVIVENVKTDYIVGNGGTGSTTFTGSPNAATVDITNAGGKTKFVFNLNSLADYKINTVPGSVNDSITVDIKN